MTTINLIPDDAGVQKLRADNEAPTTTHGVSATSATHKVEKHPRSYEQVQSVSQARRYGERRKGERRQGERRIGKQPVMLDTRSHRERRRNGRRLQDREKSALKPHSVNLIT